MMALSRLGDELRVAEDPARTHFFHLRYFGAVDALCGEDYVKPTNMPVSTWGIVTDQCEQYCKACEEESK